MLGHLENQLVELLKLSPLGTRLKMIGSLPDVPDKDVIKRWGLDAPAAYVIPMDGAISEHSVSPKFVVVLVARNARGQESVRQGDGKTIGLYEMLDAGIAELHGGQTPDGSWKVTGYQFLQDNELRNSGLQAVLIAIQTECDPPAKDAVNLGDFLVFHADYDIQPHTPDEHPRWLAENHDNPSPDLQSQTNPTEAP